MNDIQSERYNRTCPEATSPVIDSPELQIALLDQLRQFERQVAVSSITAMIAHFIGTPLNVIVGRAGLIRRHPDATEPIINDAICIQQKVEQVTDKLRAFIELMTPQLPHGESDGGDLVTEAIRLYRPIANARNIELECVPTACSDCRVNRFPAIVVITALLSLAVSEATSGSKVEIHTQYPTDDVAGSENMLLTIEIPGRVFEDPRKFARLEATPDRTSIGNSQQVLGICAAIARNAGGVLEIRAPNGVASEIYLRWPCVTTRLR